MPETVKLTLRQADALIAEKFFGAVGVGFYGPSKAHNMHTEYTRCDTWAEAKALYDKYWNPKSAADVSEDILQWRENWGPIVVDAYCMDADASQQLRAKLAEQFKIVELGWYSMRPDKKFYCLLGNHFNSNNEPDGPDGDADSEELAVALAALKSIGIEVQGLLTEVKE